MTPLNLTSETTVHHFAEWYRADRRRTRLPVEFVKDLMRIEQIAQTLPGSDPRLVYKAVLSVVEQIDDPDIFGLGLCWLDGKGYGHKPLKEVLSLRGGNPPG